MSQTETLELPYIEDFTQGPLTDWRVVDEAGDPSAWVVQSGTYQQQNQIRGKNRDNFVESYHIGSLSYLAGGMTLQDYRVSFTMTPMADTGDDVGCMVRYQNADNYYRLTMDSRFGYTRLEKRVAGQFSTLASSATGYEIGRTYSVDIEVIGPMIFVTIDGSLLVAVEDISLASGTFAFYSAAMVSFDDLHIQEASSTPAMGLSSPLSEAVVTDSSFYVSAAAANGPADGSVEFLLDDSLQGTSGEPPYMTEFVGVGLGDYRIKAVLYDGQGNPLAEDENEQVGVQGDRYAALGDSLTSGNGDNYSLDNVDPANPSLAFRGYTDPLGRHLEEANQVPTLVVDEGIGGDRSDDLAGLRIDSILERQPDLNNVLLLIGTNDAMSSTPPSRSAFAANVQATVDTIKALDSSITVTVGVPPPAFGEGVTGTIFNDPLNAVQNLQIEEYRLAITEIVTDIEIGPDFYKCFLEERNLFSLFDDNVHPKGLGYDVMARLWRDHLTGASLYTDPCDPPRFILLNLEPSTVWPYMKQNLIEAGDEYYIDEDHTVTGIPPGLGLESGVWVMTPNSQTANQSDTYITFTVDRPVDVYVAYDLDPSGSIPDWMSTYADTGFDLQVSDPSASFSMFEKSFQAGEITLGGNMAQGANGADVNYIVVVVEQ